MSPAPSAPPVDPAERKLVADTGKLSGAVGVAHVINVVGGFVLARLLGPAGYGVWKLVQLGILYTSYSHLGAQAGLDRLAPPLVTRGKWRAYWALVRASLGFHLTISLLVGFGFVVATMLARSHEATVAFGALAILVLIQPFYNHGESALALERRFGTKARMVLYYSIARIILSIAAAWYFGITGVLVVFIVTLAWAAWYMLSKARAGEALRAWRSARPRFPRRLILVGVPITMLGFSEQFFLTIDKFLVPALLSAEKNGFYQFAVSTLPILMLVPSSLRQIVAMDVYDKVGRLGDLTVCREVYDRSVLALALGSPVLIGAVYLGVPWLVRDFLPNYLESIPVIKLHAVLYYPALVSHTVWPLLVVSGRTWRVAALYLIAGGVTSCLTLGAFSFFGSGFDIMTVLIIHGTSWGLAGVGMVVAGQRLTGRNWSGAIGRGLLVLGPMALVAVELPALEWLLRAMGLAPHSFVFAVVGGLLHLVACAPLLWLLERKTGAVSFVASMFLKRLGIGRGG